MPNMRTYNVDWGIKHAMERAVSYMGGFAGTKPVEPEFTNTASLACA